MSRAHPRCIPPVSLPRLLRTLLIGVALSAALVLPGCNKDAVEPPSVENFARAWHLTSCEYRHETNSAVHVDLVAQGWTIDLYINDNGMFLYAWTPPGGSQESYGGTWAVDGQAVVLTREGSGFSWEFIAQVKEESMTLTGAHAEWDFDADGTPEPAIWSMAGTNN